MHLGVAISGQQPTSPQIHLPFGTEFITIRAVMSILLLCQICALFVGCSSHSHGLFYDTEMIVNITLSFASAYEGSCVRFISEDNRVEDHTTFEIYKRISVRLYKTVAVYPYTKYFNIIKERIPRRTCFKPIKLILDGEGMREKFSSLSHEIHMPGSLWLIIMNKPIAEYLSDVYLPFDVEVVVAQVKTRDLVEFNEAYRVDEGYPLRIKRFGEWTRSEGLNIPLTSLYARRSDLEGKLLRAGSIENWPMSSFKGGKWDGYFPRIWKEVAALINATTQAYKSRDGATGSAKSDGSWSGLVGMILDGSIDVIAAEMSINMARSKVVTFSRPVLTTRYQIYFTSPGKLLKWDAAFTPFGRDVWVALLMWIVIGTLSMTLCYDCSWYCGLDAKTRKILGMTESFFFVLQSLCQQGYPEMPRSTACRIVLFSCFLVSSVLIPSYSAAVISSLTHEKPNRPFETLEQMLQDGTHKLLVIPNSGQYDYFKHSPDRLHQDILHKLIWTVPQDLQVKNIEEALDKAFCRLKKYAFFSTQKIFEMKTEYHPMKCSLVSLTQELSPVYQSLVLKKYSPFTGVIDYYLHRLYDNGVINRVENSIRKIHIYNFNHFFIDVNAEDSFQIFFLLSCGLVLSLVLFCLEKIYYRSRQKKPHGAVGMLHKHKQGRLSRKEHPIRIEFYMG